MGVTVAVGTGVGVGARRGVAVDAGIDAGVGVGVGVGVGTGVSVGAGDGEGTGVGVGVGVTVGAGVAVGLGARVGTDVGVAAATSAGAGVATGRTVGGLGVGIGSVGAGARCGGVLVGTTKICRGAGCVGGSAGVRSTTDVIGSDGVATTGPSPLLSNGANTVSGSGLAAGPPQATTVTHTKARIRATKDNRRRKIGTRPHASNQRRPATSSARIYSCPCPRATTRRLRIPPHQDVAGLISVI